MTKKTVEERFWKYVNKTSQCWEWTGAKQHKGYGAFRVTKMERAHRYSYKLHFGTIPRGFLVLHKCDNPSCVNPSHLFLGTDKDNAVDRKRKGRNGHTANNMHGESHANAKLTEKQVREIRQAHKKGRSQVDIAKEYNIQPRNISRIVSRETWSHI